jgi:DNA-directed RNA polymerase subunit RPC12/RpoP/tetratricopeptide (TPR) repeat protein
MDITFSCTKCGQHLVIDEAGAGLSIQCPSCSANLIVSKPSRTPERPLHPKSQTTLGRGQKVEYELEENETMGIRTQWVEIKQLNFRGEFSRSPDGRYLLAWRESGPGAFLLLEERCIICRGKLQRPHDGKVADNGNFVLNDWMLGEGLKGTFYAFDCNGEVLIRKRFQANLSSNGISDDGRFCACQTCTPDSFLYLFDLTQKILLKKLKPVDDDAAGYADRYRFDTKNQILHLFYPLYLYTVELQCRFDGTFLAVTAVESSEMGIRKEGSEHYEALTRKRLGKIFLECGEKRKALAHLEAALQLDPKIGGKQLVGELKRTLGELPTD